MSILGKQTINIGPPNVPTGSDTLFDAFTKARVNFDTLFACASPFNTFVASDGIGIQSNSSTGTVTITNTGVTQIIPGSGISLTNSAGVVEISASQVSNSDIRNLFSGTGLITYSNITGEIGTNADNYDRWSLQTDSPGTSHFVTSNSTVRILGGTNVTVENDGGNVVINASSGNVESVIAGDGLIGSGTSGNITLDVGAGKGIITNPANLEVDLSVFDTDDLLEGNANLYFTEQRARESISANANITYDSNTGIISQSLTTDDVTEGGNLYFTDQRAVDAVEAEPELDLNLVTVKGLQLDTEDPADPAIGRIIWNDGDGVPQFTTDGKTVNISLEMLARCRNVTGNLIPKGTAVCIIGASANRISIAPSDRTQPGSACRTLGLTTEDIDDNGFGKVTTFGLVRGLNTNAFNEGDELFVGETPGTLTTVEPEAPSRRLVVGYVVTKNTNVGQIFVTLRRGVRVREIDDVQITNIANNDFLRYVSDNSRWENVQINTDAISEGNANLYFTEARVEEYLTGQDTVSVGGVLKIDAGVHEQIQSKTDATGTVEHDCSEGHIFFHTSPDANWTVNLTNLDLASAYATSVTLIITQGGTGYYPSALEIDGASQTIEWQGGSAPTPSIDSTDVVTFSIINNGGAYTVLGQLTGF